MAISGSHKARIVLFGGVSLIASDGTSIPLKNRKAMALLTYVALAPGLTVAREKLAELLWNDRGEAQARGSLRQTLLSLRKDDEVSKAQFLVADRENVSFISERVDVDALEFMRLLDEGRTEAATEKYLGPLFGDFAINNDAFEEWRREIRGEFQQRALLAFEQVAQSAKGVKGIAAARALVEIDPLREASQRLLMRAYAEAGERENAIKQYMSCSHVLRSELGIEPEVETQKLYEAVKRGESISIEAEGSKGLPLRVAGDKRTAVAVLPFKNLSSDESFKFFAEGLAEDLITELARYRHFLVIGHRISSNYTDKDANYSSIRHDTGAAFILEGSVRVLDRKMRVAVHLVDASSGEHVWNDRIEREVDDVFALQDEIVQRVVRQLTFDLDEAVSKQRERDPTTSNSAYSLFLKGRNSWRNGDESGALKSLLEAVAADADYARALAYVGYFYAYSLFSQTLDLDEIETIRQARDYLDRALAIDQSDPFVLQRAAMSFLLIGDHQAAMNYSEAAAKISACDSEILVIRGLIQVSCGLRDEGLGIVERGVELEARPTPGFVCALGDARHMVRDYSGSLDALRLLLNPPYYIRLCQAANLARLGRTEEARDIVRSAPKGFSVERFARGEARMCADPKDAEHWLESFRMAGVKV